MKLDNSNNPVFEDIDIFNILYSNRLELFQEITALASDEINQLISTSDIKIKITHSLTEADCDHSHLEWFVPDKYLNMDIEQWVRSQCNCLEQLNRVNEELEEFSSRGLIPLLRWLKFFVDTCRENNILWGVGRGSSVSSFVLYLIGVHRIDSMKCELDWREFLR